MANEKKICCKRMISVTVHPDGTYTVRKEGDTEGSYDENYGGNLDRGENRADKPPMRRQGPAPEEDIQKNPDKWDATPEQNGDIKMERAAEFCGAEFNGWLD